MGIFELGIEKRLLKEKQQELSEDNAARLKGLIW